MKIKYTNISRFSKFLHLFTALRLFTIICSITVAFTSCDSDSESANSESANIDPQEYTGAKILSVKAIGNRDIRVRFYVPDGNGVGVDEGNDIYHSDFGVDPFVNAGSGSAIGLPFAIVTKSGTTTSLPISSEGFELAPFLSISLLGNRAQTWSGSIRNIDSLPLNSNAFVAIFVDLNGDKIIDTAVEWNGFFKSGNGIGSASLDSVRVFSSFGNVSNFNRKSNPTNPFEWNNIIKL